MTQNRNQNQPKGTVKVKADYAHVYMPLADIYALGGPEVLNDLSRKKEGKNIVVLPMELATRMESPEKHLGLLGLGGVNTLEEITKAPYDIIGDDRAAVYHFSEGLDVAVYLERNPNNHDPFCASLMKTVEKRWGKKPEVFTTNKSDTLRAQISGLKVDRANKFLLVDSGVVNRGMIAGNLQLYEKLSQSEKGVPIDIAEDIQQERLFPNQYIRFPDNNNGHIYSIVTGDIIRNPKTGRMERKMENMRVAFLGREGRLDHLMRVRRELPRAEVLNFKPRDAEQYLAVQHGIFNPNIQVASIAGGAGSGKTLLYLTAVDMILKHPDAKYRDQMGIPKDEERLFDYIVLLKPIDILGGDSREIGFLPGDMFDKLYEHLLPFEDAHRFSRKLNDVISFKEMFFNPNHSGDEHPSKKRLNVDGRSLPEHNESIRIATTGYLRGRSFRRCLIFADEFQNLTPYEAKTLIERLGEGSKLIATGDPSQFDNPRCSKDINGFTFMINNLLDRPYTNLIKLTHSYRLEVAEDASRMAVYSR